MTILLNALNLVLCLRALHRAGSGRGRMVGIVFAFLGGTVISFAIALALEHDYLDGLGHLFVAAGSVLLFWIAAMTLLLLRANRNKVRVDIAHLAIVSIVLVVPALIGLLIANTRFKIGG